MLILAERKWGEPMGDCLANYCLPLSAIPSFTPAAVV